MANHPKANYGHLVLWARLPWQQYDLLTIPLKKFSWSIVKIDETNKNVKQIHVANLRG